jgi:hypothetical protein
MSNHCVHQSCCNYFQVLWFEHEELLQVASRGGGGGGGGTTSINAGARSEGLKLNDTKWTDGMQWYLVSVVDSV